MGQTPAGVTLAQEALPARLLTPGRYTLAASVQPGECDSRVVRGQTRTVGAVQAPPYSNRTARTA